MTQEIFGSPLEAAPTRLLQLIDKYVTVKTINDYSYTGFVHSIDPASGSIIMSIPNEDSFRTTLVLGHAVCSITPALPDPNISPPKRKPQTSISPEKILERKRKVFAWLQKHLLQAVERDGHIVFGSVTILPPYGVTDICAENSTVFSKVRLILEGMPTDFEP